MIREREGERREWEKEFFHFFCFKHCASMRVSGCVRVCIGERGGGIEKRERAGRERRERGKVRVRGSE